MASTDEKHPPLRPSSRCAFQEAMADFIKSVDLSATEMDEFKFTNLRHLQLAIKNIQLQQESKRRLRHMKRLEPFLRTMEQYGSVIEVFVNTSDILAFIWGPMKFLLLTASNFAEALDNLLDAYRDIWEQIPLLEAYQQLFASNCHLQTVLVWIYRDILDFHKEALRYFKQRAWKQLFQATWRGFNVTIDFLKQKMARHARLIRDGATIAQLEEARNFRREAELAFRNEKQAEESRKRSLVMEWLSPFPSEAAHEEHVEARSLCAGSGRWIIDSPRFQNWFHPLYCPNPLLWIHGIPGAGKSVLASLIIDEAQKHRQAETDPRKAHISVAYFYCKHGIANRNGFVATGRGILAQLLAQNQHLMMHFHQQAALSGQTELNTKELTKKLLRIALGGCTKTYIIIDGLDECPRQDRKEISEFFRSIVESLPPADMDAIRCLFLSQDDGASRKDLKDLPSIEITEASNHADIENFARKWQEMIEAKFGPLNTRHNLVRIITAKSQGMFLYAKLVLRNLLDQLSREDLLAELDSFPSGLNEVYCRILERIFHTESDTRRRKITKLLGWLVCARRPLQWSEIQAAISIDLDDEAVKLEERKFVESPKDLCASLIEQKPDQTIELVHPTAREYLINSSHIDRKSVEIGLSTLTLGYLSLPGFDPDVDRHPLMSKLVTGYFAFMEYAVACWPLHLHDACSQPVGAMEVAQLAETVDIFLEHHWSPLSPVSATPPAASKSATEALSTFQPFDFYERLTLAYSWARKQLGVHGQGPAESDVLSLSATVGMIRRVLEECVISGGPQQQAAIRSYYGANCFKCPRMNCHYFYKGFQSKAQRDDHIVRHERPFLCLVTGCYMATFGCPSEDALKKHMLGTHGMDLDDEPEFPPPPRAPSHAPKSAAQYACTLCPKKFTRNHNLKSHMRTHAGERPFSCAFCNRSFVRLHDKNRHEAVHEFERQFRCHGELANGEQWGCKAEFSRADKLADHLRTKQGRQCLQPLLLQERQDENGTAYEQKDVSKTLARYFNLDTDLVGQHAGDQLAYIFQSRWSNTPGSSWLHAA